MDEVVFILRNKIQRIPERKLLQIHPTLKKNVSFRIALLPILKRKLKMVLFNALIVNI